MAPGVDPLIGRTVAGKFAIVAHLGGGAMGEVYRARHVRLDTQVALKVMRRDLAEDKRYAERFYREAKAASRLEHPNSVRVLDYGEEPDGLLYIAMEFLGGRDLFRVIEEEHPLPEERVVGFLLQILSALSMAHGLGIVHRDLKPENIMVLPPPDAEHDHDIVKVCDFGVAKLADPRSYDSESGGRPLTATGTLIGTPEYMSPEQAKGDPLDPRSDLYSIGIVMFQMLTARVPFTAESAMGVALKQITDEPPPPSRYRQGLTPELEAICLRALHKKPDDRFQSAKEMRAELRALASKGLSLPDLAAASMDLPSVAPVSSSLKGPTSTPSGLASSLAETIPEAQTPALPPTTEVDVPTVPIRLVSAKATVGGPPTDEARPKIYLGAAAIVVAVGVALGLAASSRQNPGSQVRDAVDGEARVTSAPPPSAPRAPEERDDAVPVTSFARVPPRIPRAPASSAPSGSAVNADDPHGPPPPLPPPSGSAVPPLDAAASPPATATSAVPSASPPSASSGPSVPISPE